MYSASDAHCHLEGMNDYSPAAHPDFLHITCGYSLPSSIANVKLANESANVYCCIGIAPQEAMKLADVKAEAAKFEEFATAALKESNKIVAIGEVGLDYHWAKTDEERKKQKECFTLMLALAKRLQMPVVIHTRDAMSDTIAMLRSFNGKIMMHCFSGTNLEAASLLSMGAILSIPPIHSKERKKIIKLAGIKTLVAETDAPYIGKVPQDAQNSSNMIADAVGLPQEQAQKDLLRNTLAFFGING